MADKEKMIKDAGESASITLTAGQLVLLGMLTDKLITLATTISQVSGMTDEEAKAKIVEEEALSDFLLQQIKEG